MKCSQPSAFRRLARCGVATLFAASALTAHAGWKALINPGDQGEQALGSVYATWNTALEQAMRKEKAGDGASTLSFDMTAALSAARTQGPDVIVGPAQLIGSAVRYGYDPVIGLDQQVQAVLVAPENSAITTFAQAAGKRLGRPMQDSLVTYLLRGETNANNTTIKRHFASVYETRYQDALLICLQLRKCDVVAVEREVLNRWVAAGQRFNIILQSKAVPGISLAIKKSSKITADALRSDLSEVLGPRNSGAKVTHFNTSDFAYVSELGYFTPRDLKGASVVDAAAVAALLKGKARYIDARNDVEFGQAHVPGAMLVPYVEKSTKDADYDGALDSFDTSKLGPDRDVDLIFGCNGAECWKSYKASISALKAGYKRVYWFRGGLPEWKTAGFKTASAK